MDKTRRVYCSVSRRLWGRWRAVDILGNKMLLDLDDKGISQFLYLDRTREVVESRIFSDNLREDDVVLDIGANIGYYVLMEASVVDRVIAVEPLPSNIEMLNENLELNGYSNVDVRQMALGNADGEVDFYVSEASNQGAIFPGAGRDAGMIRTPITTLDDFLSEEEVPSVIRMDVEGAEVDILKGGQKTLGDPRLRMLFIEVHNLMLSPQKLRYLFETLRENGFEIKAMVRQYGSLWVVRERFSRLFGDGFVDKVMRTRISDLLANRDYLDGRLGQFAVYFERTTSADCPGLESQSGSTDFDGRWRHEH